MKKYLIFLFSVILSPASATTHNVPGQYPAIQNALNICTTGDTILVQPGLYLGYILWPQVANIKLLSAGDSSNTFLDGAGMGTLLYFDQNPFVNNYTVISGFTFQNAINGISIHGGGPYINNCVVRYCTLGVQAYSSYALLRNLNIHDNVCTGASYTSGVGLHIEDGNVTLSKCIIRDNKALNSQGWVEGVGVYLARSHTNFIRTQIINNFADTSYNGNYYNGGGVFIENFDSSVFTNVLISNNTIPYTFFPGGGSGIYIKKCWDVRLMNCTIANNYKFNAYNFVGDGIRILEGSLTITNSILWNDTTGVVLSSLGSLSPVINVSYSDIKGGFSGMANINSDPLFAGSGTYSLQLISPCVNAGTLNGAPANDLNGVVRPQPVGTNPDMGAYEVNQANVSVVENTENSPSWSVYSQNDILVIQFVKPAEVPLSIKLFTIDGRILKTFHTSALDNEVKINTGSISPGIYILSVENKNSITEKKVILD
jgi:hypothetical protein